MSLFRIKVTDLVAEIESIYSYSYAFCRPFLTSDNPDFIIRITQKDIEKEREKSITEDYQDPPSDLTLETYSILRQISEKIIDYDSFMMHGAAIAVKNNTYIFAAKSGVGKTTHLLRWLEHLNNAIIINGDKPFITTTHTPMVYGSPWAGKERLFSTKSAQLKAIVFMERSEENHLRKISFSEAFPLFLQQIYIPDNKDKMRKTIQLMQRLTPTVSFWRFQCNNFKDDCFDVSYNALINDK